MLSFDPFAYPFPSRRTVVYGNRGMVATAHPLAAQVGLDALKRGGNAIDAAIAVAASLTVLSPNSTGIGGDTLALIWYKGRLHGLNSGGPAPRAITLQSLAAQGLKSVPKHGPFSVTVPGTPAAWVALASKFGNLSLEQVLAAAIELARSGFPMASSTAIAWERIHERYRKEFKESFYQPWFDTFAPQHRAPRAGEIWRSADQAGTLEAIASDDAAGFYRGKLAERITSCVQDAGGFLNASDLASYEPEWVNPIHATYRGFDVWQLPPNAQGAVALVALNILKGYEVGEWDASTRAHHQIEAVKLAFARGADRIADPRHVPVELNELLSDASGEEGRRLIDSHAATPGMLQLPGGGTVYLCTADCDGNMVSLMQSNYFGFGCGLVVPGTGIALHCRGNAFSLDPSHPNCLAAGKRPFHTLSPGFLTHGDKPIGPFGITGGTMQPQGQVQLMMNTIDCRLNPQAALDAPRWLWTDSSNVSVEKATDPSVIENLRASGHKVSISGSDIHFGHGQIIWRGESGVLCGGTEYRREGSIAAW